MYPDGERREVYFFALMFKNGLVGFPTLIGNIDEFCSIVIFGISFKFVPES